MNSIYIIKPWLRLVTRVILSLAMKGLIILLMFLAGYWGIILVLITIRYISDILS